MAQPKVMRTLYKVQDKYRKFGVSMPSVFLLGPPRSKDAQRWKEYRDRYKAEEKSRKHSRLIRAAAVSVIHNHPSSIYMSKHTTYAPVTTSRTGETDPSTEPKEIVAKPSKTGKPFLGSDDAAHGRECCLIAQPVLKTGRHTPKNLGAKGVSRSKR